MEEMCILSRSTFGIQGPKLLDQGLWVQGPKTVFRGPKLSFFCKYLKNSKRQNITLNCKNVKLHMTYNITSISKFKVLSDIIETGKDLLFVQGTNRLFNSKRIFLRCGFIQFKSPSDRRSTTSTCSSLSFKRRRRKSVTGATLLQLAMHMYR